MLKGDWLCSAHNHNENLYLVNLFHAEIWLQACITKMRVQLELIGSI